MSKVQGKDSDLSSELPFSNLKDRCEACRNISACNVCGSSISGFEHNGVRATAGQESGIWHYASQCEIWWRPTLEERLHMAEHLLGPILHKLFCVGLGGECREGCRKY